MAHAMDELLSSNALSEEVRSSLSEAWDTQLTEARETITAELREEFAQRYENDKEQMVEAMDKMIGDVIGKELEEFKEDKAKVVEKFKVGDIIKGAEGKGYSTFGCFFSVNGELDVLVHLQEISYSRVNHPEEIFNIGDKHDLKVISVDKEKLQVGCSIKQLSQDPFEKITNYELNKKYEVKVI